ncbi:MAG: aspartate/glutamate racemase family protein [Acidobacteriota bacterium]
MHLVITDSGLGGLGVCAAIERQWRGAAEARAARLTYFNAWPEQGRGYNAMPDDATRLAAFDRALTRMSRLCPDRIVIACNTLSVLYSRTAFARQTSIPVLGILEAGISLFADALLADAGSTIALFGTRITIESDVHRDGLVARGIAADRIVPVPCHGLAADIESDVEGLTVGRLIDQCAERAVGVLPAEGPLMAGLCCTHYGYVANRFRAALERRADRSVTMLDPNGSLVRLVMRQAAQRPPDSPAGTIAVDVISKVRIDEGSRLGIGRLIEPISAATARALYSYAHVPDLF